MRDIKYRAWDGEKMRYWNITSDFNNTDYYHIIGCESGLMQYTGLKDKNGKKIYEGDVVKDVDEVGKIVWIPNGLAFGITYIEGGETFHLSDTFINPKDRAPDIEIIGNIYEDEYLLNK